MSSVANQIHELLKTMNPTEKSYVKKTFSANEKNMSQLFNDLNKSKQFDRKTFLKQFKKRPYMKYLSQNCNYLLKNITRSLIDYNSENLTEINIMARLSSISLLVKKGMFSACLQKIDKEVELAITYQYFEYGYKLIKLKERFYKIYLLKEFSYDEHVALAEKKKFFIEQLQLIDELDLLSIVLSNESLSAREKIKLVESKFTKLKLTGLERLSDNMPLNAKLAFNYIKYQVSVLKGEPNLKYSKQSLIDFEKLSFLKGIYFESYVKIVANYLKVLVSAKEFVLFFEMHEKYMEELKGFAKWKTMRTSPFYYIVKYFTFIEASVLSNSTNKAIKKAIRYQQIISKTHNKLMDSFVSFAIYLNAIVFFNNGYVNETLDAIELLQKDKRIETRYFYKVMQILCHYKLDNMMLVDSLSDSVANCLRKNNKPAMLKEFLKLKKCILDINCNKFDDLEFLPYLDLNVLKIKTLYTNAAIKQAG